MIRFFTLFLLTPLFLMGSDFSATVELSNSKVRVDDELFVTLTLNYLDSYYTNPDEMVAKLLERGTLALAPFAFENMKILSKKEANGRVVEVIQFELDPQVIGNHLLSFFGISFYPKNEEEKHIELISEVFTVTVVAAPANPDYRGEVAPLLNFDTWYPMAPNFLNRREYVDQPVEGLVANNLYLWKEKQIPWLTMTILALVGLLFYFIKTRPSEESAERRVFRIKRQALERLEILREKRLPVVAEYSTYYIELVDTVRLFLKERYELKAMVQTTDEFLEEMSEKPILEESTLKSVKDFFTRADLVKFSQYTPSKDECAYAEITAKKVISLK